MKEEIDSNTIIVGDFNTPLTSMDRSSKQKLNKESSLKWYIRWNESHWYLHTLCPNSEEYTFSSAHGTFSRIDHILDHKSNLHKFKKIKIVSSIFSNHSAMRLDTNYKNKSVRNTNTWRWNNTFLSRQPVTEEIKREITKLLETNDTENTIQNLWDANIIFALAKI